MHELGVKKKFQISVKDVKMEFWYMKVGRRGAHDDAFAVFKKPIERFLASLLGSEVGKEREERVKKRDN